MKMVDKTDQSDRAPNPNEIATARHCRRGPCVYRAIRDGWPCPVIREKSQSRAQNDSLSLSPAHDSTSLYLHFRALGRLLLWAAYFWPQAFTRQRMRFAPIIPVGGERGSGRLIKVIYCFHRNNDDSRCEAVHAFPPIRP